MSEAETGTERPADPVEVSDGPEGFPPRSKYPFVVGVGMFLTALGLIWILPILVVGIPVLLYGIVGWVYELGFKEYESATIPKQKTYKNLGVDSMMLAVYALIVVELLFFAALLVAWVYLRATRGPFPPEGFPAPTLTLGLLMFLVLVVGSGTFAWARSALQNGNRSRFTTGMAATFVLGIVFLAVVGLEWFGLLAGGVDWTTGPYGATYYIATGALSANVIVSLGLVAVILIRTIRGHFSPDRNLMVRTSESYWHLVSVMALLTVSFIYLPISMF